MPAHYPLRQHDMHAADEELEALLDASGGPSQPKPPCITAITERFLHLVWAFKIPQHLLLVMAPAILSMAFVVWLVRLLFYSTSVHIHLPPATVSVSLGTWLNNQGVTWGGAAVHGGFDGNGSSYRAEEMPCSFVMSGGVNVKPFPSILVSQHVIYAKAISTRCRTSGDQGWTTS
jgi:hypothetical protein